MYPDIERQLILCWRRSGGRALPRTSLSPALRTKPAAQRSTTEGRRAVRDLRIGRRRERALDLRRPLCVVHEASGRSGVGLDAVTEVRRKAGGGLEQRPGDSRTSGGGRVHNTDALQGLVCKGLDAACPRRTGPGLFLAKRGGGVCEKGRHPRFAGTNST